MRRTYQYCSFGLAIKTHVSVNLIKDFRLNATSADKLIFHTITNKTVMVDLNSTDFLCLEWIWVNDKIQFIRSNGTVGM